MKNWMSVVWGLASIGCLSVFCPVHAADVDRHVVVVSLDGLAAYLVDDPKVPLPTIRKLAREGCIVDGGMTVSNPSVTWPNHTTLVTGVSPGKHGVLANGVLVRGGPGLPTRIDPNRDQSELVRLPTIVDAAHAAGLTTAEINWPCTRGSKSLDDSFSDVPQSVEHMTPRLRTELLELGLLTDETDASFKKLSPVGRDYVWTEAACHVIRQRKPNLLLLHLLNVDSTHHAFGPRTSAGYTANAYADMCLSRIISALDDAGIRDKTTLIVVSDHGFTTTPTPDPTPKRPPTSATNPANPAASPAKTPPPMTTTCTGPSGITRSTEKIRAGSKKNGNSRDTMRRKGTGLLKTDDIW